MKVLFLSQHKHPHVGGVEKHTYELNRCLIQRNYKVKIISSEDIEYPKVKFIGVLYIWFWFLRNVSLIKKSDIVHCHDVFIWYLPFRFLFPSKKVFVTFHGWEGQFPISLKNILLKRIANRLSSGSIAVGKYIQKWYGIKADFISYGAVSVSNSLSRSEKNRKRIVFVGRLEKDTGLLKFLDFLSKNRKYNVDFCGDGELKNECQKYGRVHGFTDPKPFYKKSYYCVPGGYLSALEALASGCKLKLYWHNPLKRDYWKLSPFIMQDKNWAKKQTWNKMADLYLKLWQT